MSENPRYDAVSALVGQTVLIEALESRDGEGASYSVLMLRRTDGGLVELRSVDGEGYQSWLEAVEV